jgi:hypothetical protein
MSSLHRSAFIEPRRSLVTDLSAITAEKKWTYVESSGDQPTPRYSVTLNIFQDKLVLFGGFDGNRLNSVHFLDTRSFG